MAMRLILAASLAVLAGCAGYPPQPAGRPIPGNIPGIVVNKTTAGEARALLGAPDRILTSNTRPGEQWGYRYRGDFERRVFWVDFSADGVVREVGDSPDFESGKYVSP
jgi:hypothetical protein